MNKSVFQQTLFKTHSTGQIGTWSVTVEDRDDGVLMIVKSAKVEGGAEVETPTRYSEGKNIGRSNETTPLEQAILEAKSKVSKKLDKGYVTERPKQGEQAKNGLGFIMPMLAQPIDKVKKWHFPVYVQPKFDGHRMLATVQDDQVVLYSRQGKVLDVEHIRDVLQNAYEMGYWDGDTLDGEVYAHGETLQRISSLVKKPKPESKQLVYHVYDIALDKCYEDRFTVIDELDTLLCSAYITLTPTNIVNDVSYLNSLHSLYIGRGYEGTIVRQVGVGYEQGKRSKSLMKKKDFQDAEFQIIGLKEGKPNERQGTKVGIYTCKAANDKEFDVLAPGDAQEKHHHAEHGHENIGRKLTVKYFNLTPDGIPFHPVALRIREDV
jgi:DNA ligase 1